MPRATGTLFALLLLAAGTASAQQLEYVFSPEPSTDLAAPFAVGTQNGARAVTGPWDLDRDGRQEILVAQHNGAGGRIHVIENAGVDTWELVYTTAFIDSSANSNNARHAIGTDLDGDGNWEITTVAGNAYKLTNPAYVVGAYVWEHDGTVGSDNYGTAPATVGNFYELDNMGNPSAHVQRMTAADIDRDGRQELLLAVNGHSANDVFYVLSVSGTFEPNNAGSGFETWVIEHRVGPRENGNAFGGGSPSEIIPGDFNGDGWMDISYHSWNNFIFFNATNFGPDAYALPDIAAENRFIQAAPTDDVALFGGIAADIDGDGNDEVFYTNLNTTNVSVLDYDAGDDVLQIDASKFAFDAIPLGGNGGIVVGDLDDDGNKELIVGGRGYTAAAYNRGEPSQYIRVAEYVGGDPKAASSYEIHLIDTGSPVDTMGFATVFRDSLGVKTKRNDMVLSKQGLLRVDNADPIFPSGIAYLGDADGDGAIEVALSFQGIDDSLLVVDEVWNADSLRYEQTPRDTVAAPMRAFVRIYEFENFAVAIEDERVVLPDDYKLSANYPNPFNPETRFSITLPLEKTISVKVYDVAGRLVKTLIDGQRLAAGTYDVTWDGTNAAGAAVASGTYVYTLEYGTFRQSHTMTLVK